MYTKHVVLVAFVVLSKNIFTFCFMLVVVACRQSHRHVMILMYGLFGWFSARRVVMAMAESDSLSHWLWSSPSVLSTWPSHKWVSECILIILININL